MTTTTLSDYRAAQAKAMLEADLAAEIARACKTLRLLRYHTYDSRKSEAGYPDEHIVNPRTGRGIYRELKRVGKRPTADQQKWLAALGIENDVDVWTPEDWFSGRILAELQALSTRR